MDRREGAADAAIEARGLFKSFGQTEVLKGIDVTVEHGTLVALLGPNGSGKTTTIRILTTLLPADGGTVTVAGHDIARDGAAVRRSIGLTAQQATVDGMLTGRENLELFARLYHLGGSEARRRAGELLEQFGLVDAADLRAAAYSGGMRRRLDLATSMIAQPRILFLDEPTTGLDPRGRANLWDVIRGLLAAGTTILLTTQYMEEADQLADRITVIHDGVIVADDVPAALKRQVGVERLVLAFAGLADADAAARALQAGAASDAGPRLDCEARQVTLALHDPDHLRRALDAVHAAGVKVSGVELRTPTLDDVFFELTGAAT